MYEYEDIVFTFGGIDEVNANVYGLYLLDGDEIFDINVGMTNQEIYETLGLPTYQGIVI